MKRVTIECNMMGTSTQLGRVAGLTIIIEEYSTPEDQQVLMQAFKADGNKGMCRALSKMKSKGHISIPGTLGYDLNYIRQFPSDSGQKIRFVTDRPITMGENWTDSRSSDYSLSAGELQLSTSDPKASTGTVMPACQLTLNKQNELSIEAFQNPWKLIDIRVH